MTQPLTLTILIIDDSATNRRIYSRLSRRVNPDVIVRSFGHPHAALDWLAANEADLIITDYKMPDLTGDQLVRSVRSRHQDPDIPIIVVTAYDDREFRVTSLEAGATDFLLSPVDHTEFVTRASNLLKLRAQQKILIHRAQLLEYRLEASLTAQAQLLRDSREALAQVIDTVPALISAADRDGRCVFVNALQADAVRTAPSNLAGQNVDQLFGPERGTSSRRLDKLVFETGQPAPTREEEVLAANGESRFYLTSKVPLRDSHGEIISVLTTSVDITDRRVAEKRLQHMANHDLLTNLPNRAMLRERLRRELARGRRGDRHFALHFIDLDRFKAINDSRGHHSGDQVLRRVADALSGLVDELAMVARIGGDEFAVLQPEVAGADDAAALAKNIIEVLGDLIGTPDLPLVGASIGITLSPQDGNDPDELLKNSDQAMYSAKKNGGNTLCFFAPAMHPSWASQVAQMGAELRTALARQEFVLYYQPQIDLRRRTVFGAEALLRWRRPGVGVVTPVSFLAQAEESGLIVPINEWVLMEACRQAAAWQDAGFVDLRMSINLSVIQFKRRSVYSAVSKAIEVAGVTPALIDLELTESVLLGEAEDAVSQLHTLKELGVTLSLDDFGTGYSSLSYVRRFPLDRLKIDRSFIQRLGENQSDLAIVRTIIDLAHILRLRVLAEGVETLPQLSRLQAEGCDEVQGLYFSKPLPAEAFTDHLIRERGKMPAVSVPIGQ